MKKFILLSATTLMFASCGPTEKDAPEAGNTDTVADATEVVQEEVKAITSCYAWTSKKDTIKLQLERSGDLVTGELNYLWAEKDNNRGTVKGEMRGDTLMLDYTFMSEGMESVRQEFFLRNDEGFVNGTIDYEHLKEPFKAKDVKFNGPVLKAVDCK